MSRQGTVVNGAIVLDDGITLPEGARVWVGLDDEDDIGPPPTDETYEEHLAILRQSIAEMKAGVPGMPLDVAMAQIAAEFGLPPVGSE